MILKLIKRVWEILNNISPETRNLIIIFLFGYLLYSQITETTRRLICERFQEEVLHNKKAEQYSLETSIEINHLILLISERDEKAFDVLLLNYHNNTLSLQGYKYLYLSCLTEASKSLDEPLLKLLWNKLDYVYYADELAKIHSHNFVLIENIEYMGKDYPKLYRLIKASDALAATFFTIEGLDSAIGMVIIFYREPKKYCTGYYTQIFSCIQRLAILLDYENIKTKN